METEGISQIRTRVSLLESLMRELAVRVLVLEQRIAAPAGEAPPEPPPVLRSAPPPARDRRTESQSEKPSFEPASEPPQKPARDIEAEEFEYRIGARVLPWAGAIVVLVALGYLVGVGIQRGWIGPGVQFASALALSFAFIGVGFWRREEKEEFGKLLIGIGSCGAYLTFAGGHVFHKLYLGETLVALFAAWSLLNLAFSYWSFSRSFLVIGLLGGLSAALMPLRESNTTLNAALHFAIVAPAVLIAYRHGWRSFLAGIWVVSTAALVPAMLHDTAWAFRVSVLYANCILTVSAYAAASDKRDIESFSAFPPLALMATGFGGLMIRNDAYAALHEAILGSAACAAALFCRVPAARGILASSGVAAALLWGPLGFRGLAPAAIDTALALALALVSGWFGSQARQGPEQGAPATPRLALTLGSVLFGVAVCYYSAQASLFAPAIEQELALLAGMVLAIGALGWAGSRIGSGTQLCAVIASLAAFPLISRALWLLGGPASFIGPEAMLVFGWAVLGLTLAVVGSRSAWPVARDLGVLMIALAAGYYAVNIAVRETAFGLESSLLSVLILATALAGTFQVGGADRDARRVYSSCVMLVAGSLAARLGFLLLSHAAPAWPKEVLAAVPLALIGVGFGSFAIRGERHAAAFAGASFAACAFTQAVRIGLEFGERVQPAIVAQASVLPSVLALAASAAALGIAGIASTRFPSVKNVGLGLAALGVWAHVSQLGLILLGDSGLGLSQEWSLTAAWTLYAGCLLAGGFAGDKPTLRYWGLCVFGATVGKVFLFDLAATIDPLIRVGMLFALGTAMLAASLWYIRRQAHLGERN